MLADVMLTSADHLLPLTERRAENGDRIGDDFFPIRAGFELLQPPI
jgi:hypothetical protein